MLDPKSACFPGFCFLFVYEETMPGKKKNLQKINRIP